MDESTPPRRARRVTMEDVANAAGVSKTTVSRVLGGIDAGIPKDTQQRVNDLAEAMGYRPNMLASALRRQTSDTIGFVSDVIASTPNAGAMVQGAQDAAWTFGKVLLLTNTGGIPEVERKAIETMHQRQVDGVVYATMYHQVRELPAGLDDLPCVLLDVRSRGSNLSSVAPDESAGAAEAVRYLAGLGHRRIGFINSAAAIPAAHERLAGYREELIRQGLEFDDALIAYDLDEFTGGIAAASRLLDLDLPPTALFCFNDRMAAGAIRAARLRGMSVPAELSVVGFDNQELVALLTDPPLTTFQLPHYEMGQWAVQQLLGEVQGSMSRVEHRIPFRFIERESAAAPLELR